MQKIRRHGQKVLLVLMGAMLIGGAMLLGASPQDLFKQAQQQYERHNYKQALELCQKALDASPEPKLLMEAGRLRVMSLCRLNDAKATEAVTEAVKKHPELDKDADFQLTAGDFYARYGHGKLGYEAYTNAARLYEDGKKPVPAFDAWLSAAQMLRRDYNIVPEPPATQPTTTKREWTWQDRFRASMEKAAEICQHAASLAVDDERKGKALLIGGEYLLQLGDWPSVEKAISLWRQCAKEFGKSPAAPDAQFRIGGGLERFGRFVEALPEYERVIQEYPRHDRAKEAKTAIDRIRAPVIAVTTNQTWLPGDKPELYWTIRNVKKLHLTAWSVDLLKAVQGSDFAAQDPMKAIVGAKGNQVAAWAFETPDDGKHQFHGRYPPGGGDADQKQTTLPIAVPLDKSGAYLIQATGSNPAGQEAKGHCLLVISRIGAVAKSDTDEIVVFATDSASGEPAAGAEVAVVRQYEYRNNQPVVDRAAGKVNDGGLCPLKLDRRTNYTWTTAVRRGDDQALLVRGGYSWYWWGHGQPFKVYGFTDRPVYRPKQTAYFKQILRQHKEGAYENYAGKTVRVEIRNPKGEVVYAKDHVTDEFGALEGSLAIGDNAPLGVYHIQVTTDRRQGWQSPGNQFRVEEYKKPEFKVAVEPAAPDYRVGDEVKIKIAGRYYFGQPVAGADVSFTLRKQSYTHHFDWPRPWQWYYEAVFYGGGYGRRGPWRPWWRPQFDELVATGTAKTDSNGEAFITVKAEPVKGHEELDLKFVVQVEMTDSSRRVIRSSGEVKVTHSPFYVFAKPAQAVYQPADSIEVNVRTENPSGQPVPGEFDVEAWRIERIRKVDKKDGQEQVTFEEKLAQKVFAQKVSVPDTGRASVRFVPDMTGHFKVIVRQAQPKAGQKPVEGSCEIWVASRTGAEAQYAYNDLTVVPASDQCEIGQTLKVLVNTAKTNSRVLLTGEADDILFTMVVHVDKNSKLVELPVTKELCPNFTLSACLLRDNKLFMDSKQIVVPPTHRFLNVQASLDKGSLGGGQGNEFQPREKTKVRVKITDRQTGRPVVGQAALMLVDASVYYIQPEFRQAIEKDFYGQTRQLRVATQNSFAAAQAINPHPYAYAYGVARQMRRAGPGFFDEGGAQGAEMLNAAAAPGAAFRGGRGLGAPEAAMPPAPMEEKAAAKEGADREAGEPEAPLADAIVREHFRDTVLWAGTVITDGDGVASVDVEMPDQLTTFALHVIAFDKDTRVGQVGSDVITTKHIIARLEGGRFLTEGDQSWVTVIAHNYFKEPQKLMVDLAATDALTLRQVSRGGRWLDYKPGQALEVSIPSGGEERIDFLTTAARSGEVTLTARVRGTKESDAIQLVKPIVPWGADKIVSSHGVLKGLDAKDDQAASVDIEVPKEIRPGSQTLTIVMNPTVASVALEALPFLAAYPYGCVEQTMSRFLPTVLMRKTLQEMRMDPGEARKFAEQQAASDPKLAARWKLIRQRMDRNPVYSTAEVEAMISAGLKRLADFQHPDGSWGWWRDDRGDPYMTAYVMAGLLTARESDVKVPAELIERGVKFLIDRAAQPKVRDDVSWWQRHQDNDNTRAYMLYVIGRAQPAALKDPKLLGHLERLFKGRDALSDYGRAYLALASHAAGKAEDAKILVENFQNTAQVDDKAGAANWGQRGGWWYWYDGADETTAWVLQAMLTISPDSKYVPMAVKYLLGSRQGMVWGNTKSTATVILALARYAKVTGELDCDQTFHVAVRGYKHSVRVTRQNLFSLDDRLELAAGELPPGKWSIALRRQGKGTMYWSAHVRYVTTADPIKASGNKVAVQRQYFRLVPEKFENTRQVWRDGKWVEEKFPDLRHKKEPLAFGAEIASGDLIEVQLATEAENNYEYMLFEDPKPSGCEPYRLTSGGNYEGDMYAYMELRDAKVVLFANWLAKGKRTMSYELVCEQPGTFRVLPTSGEAMYSPFVQAISDSGKIVITPKPQK